jgi:hypothetical protein
MSELSHCFEMAMMCRQCALEDGERRQKWLAEAEKWNQRAGAVLGHSFEERFANRSKSPSEDKKKRGMVRDRRRLLPREYSHASSLAASIALKKSGT